MRAAFPALVLLALAACDRPQAGEPAVRAELGEAGAADGSSPALQSDCRAVTFEGSRFTHCVADPASHTIRMDLAGADGAPFRSLAALARSTDASQVAFAFNAGMFDDASQPIGYYVEDGKRLAQLNRADGAGNFHLLPNGVFCFGDGRARVIETLALREAGTSCRYATQRCSKPSASSRPRVFCSTGRQAVVRRSLRAQSQMRPARSSSSSMAPRS